MPRISPRGLGFVYNPGERVLSTTTPLFSLVLAVLRPIWNNLPQLGILIGALSLAAGGLIFWSLGRYWALPMAGYTGLLLYPTFPLLATTLGSETPLYLALALMTFASYAQRKYTQTGIFAALTILTRPDGILVTALIAAHYLIRVRKTIPWRAVVVFLVPLAAWGLFAEVYFGSPIPVTLAAKQGQFSLIANAGFLPGLRTLGQAYLNFPHYIILGTLALLGLFLVLWRFRDWALLALWPILYTASYSILKVSSYFWYYAPLVPGLIGMAGVGLSGLWEGTSRLRRPWSAITIALIFVLAGYQIQDLSNLRELPDPRFPSYQTVGHWLSENTDTTAMVGTLEVGIIGYYSTNPMLDFAGLIQPQVAAQFGPGTTYEDAALWAVENYSFEYLILHDGLMPRLEADYVEARCSSIQRFPGEQSNYEFDMVIYACTN